MAIEFNRARKLILDNIKLLDLETVTLDQGLNRIMAENFMAPMNVPPFPRSPLDGFALKSADTKTATAFNPVKLKISGNSDCGKPYNGPLLAGQCIRISTGAPVPKCVDAVIAQEEVEQQNVNITMFQSLKPGDNVVQAGEDIHLGELAIKKGTCLKPAHLGMLASLGRDHVQVYNQPQVAVISTGHELVPPGSALPEAKIYDCNSTMISAMVRSCHALPSYIQTVNDDVKLLSSALMKALNETDIVITSGGVSVGNQDLVALALKNIGCEILFWRLKMKPGTPMLVAKYNNKLIFCLSGNPGAAHVTFDLFVRPALYCMSNRNDWQRPYLEATLEHPIKKNNGQNRYIRAKCKYSLSDSSYSVTAAERERPGVISASVESNALIYRPAGSENLNAGDIVSVELLDQPVVVKESRLLADGIENTIPHKSIKRFFPQKAPLREAKTVR